MAYSSKIHDQAFDRYRQNTNNWRFAFSLILAVIAVSGFLYMDRRKLKTRFSLLIHVAQNSE